MGQSHVYGPKTVGQFVPVAIENEQKRPFVESHGIVQSHASE